jgi:hypothetical protein
MSTDKLQQAVTLIKAGDKKGGLNLLVDIVNTDPQNETAWLWLASVVPPNKRIFCLEKVLSLNPNHLQAKQYLEKLKASEQIQANPAPQPGVAKESLPKVSEPPLSRSRSPQYWTVAFGNKLVSIILLEATQLITVDVIPMKAPAVLEQIGRGPLTKEWCDQNVISGANYKSINLNQILRARLLLNDITIAYRDNAQKELSAKIICRDDKTSDAILDALQHRLGDRFARTTQPNSRREVAGRSLLLLLFGLGGTGYCYWATLDLVGKELHGKYSGIGTLLQLIGPNGMLCIGSGVILLILFSIISQFIKPPLETHLIRKGPSQA